MLCILILLNKLTSLLNSVVEEKMLAIYASFPKHRTAERYSLQNYTTKNYVYYSSWEKYENIILVIITISVSNICLQKNLMLRQNRRLYTRSVGDASGQKPIYIYI